MNAPTMTASSTRVATPAISQWLEWSPGSPVVRPAMKAANAPALTSAPIVQAATSSARTCTATPALVTAVAGMQRS